MSTRERRFCAYCGTVIDPRSTACRQHGYLVRLDERFLGDRAHLQAPSIADWGVSEDHEVSVTIYEDGTVETIERRADHRREDSPPTKGMED